VKPNNPITIATRGSALALAQANLVLGQCRGAFPGLDFELKIVKTTGDKLQTASLAQQGNLPKGLFTKELEVALLEGQADLAVHSLKDLPTELPDGLTLGAVLKREDVRDVLLYRDAHYARTLEARPTLPESGPARSNGRAFKPGTRLVDLPAGTIIATSSTRRKAQVLAKNPAVRVQEIRGNVVTRMEKLARNPEIDCTVLALAGMHRLKFRIGVDGAIHGDAVPPGLLATILDTEEMLPCVGQGAIAIEIRRRDTRVAEICERLDDFGTRQCVLAERAFLSGMGGGCQSPVAAHAEAADGLLKMRVLSFASGPVRCAQGTGPLKGPEKLGLDLAAKIKAEPSSGR
jgi:hydroxymethylbilane synthase